MGGLFRATLWIAQQFSPAAALRISGLIARLLYLFNTDPAQATKANLAVSFPDLPAAERAQLCRRSLQNMVLLFFEFAQMAYWPRERLLAQITEIQGKAQLDDLFSEQQGALILVPHFGNWEMFCLFLGHHYRFAALYDPPKIRSLEPVILKTRERFQGELFAINAAGMRNLLRSLYKGAMVALLPDQVPVREQGVYAPFFTQPALTMTLAHRLAQKSNQRVLMASMERVADPEGYHYRLTVEPLVESTEGLDAQQFATVMNRSIERLVRRAPEQYQWEYKRFKRPPDARKNDIYRRQ